MFSGPPGNLFSILTMCKRTKHLSIQDDCWIFRIQAEDFTRGGDKFRGVELRPPSELCLHILCKS